MRALIFIFIFTFTRSIVLSQSAEGIDSLKHQLVISKNDTSSISTITNLCSAYWGVNPDSSMKYGQMSLTWSRKINFNYGESSSLHALGVLYRILGDYPKALDITFEGLQIAENHLLIVPTLRCLNGIGLIYLELNDNSKAISYFQRGLMTAIDNHDLYWTAQLQANIGSPFKNRNQIDSAFYYVNKALIKADSLKGTFLPKMVFRLMSEIQFEMGNYQNAFENVHKSLLINQKTNDHRSLSGDYTTLSVFFKKLNQVDSSIFYAKKGLIESQKIKHKAGVLKASKLLAELYEPKDIKEALYYYKIANSTNDELYGSAKTLDLQRTLAEEQERQRQKDTFRIAHENKLKQYAYLISLAILFLFAFLLYRNNRMKQKANVILQEQKDKVENTLTQLKTTQTQLIQKEKLASLGELTAGIAHEIQNPLNFVNNFSELSVDLAKDLKEEIHKPNIDKEYVEELLTDLSQNQEKINHHGKRASSIVKGMLEHSRASTGVKELTDINKLADEYLRLSYHGLRAKDKSFNADFKTDFDENLPKISIIQQDIGRVLLNLINNAFYAVNEKNRQNIERNEIPKPFGTEGVSFKPTVTISTQVIDNQIVIKVKDNGMGMSESVRAKVFQPFFTTKPTGSGTGLGLSLAYDIVTKGHSGTLEVVSTEGGVGSEFSIQLPIH
jgi:two-component system, NtrC family, sensor kinase